MSAREFEVIDRYFKVISESAAGVVLGPGDDCAVLSFPGNSEVCTSTDTLIEGIHFPVNADASLVATRLVGANLSDLAAMGAEPHSCLIALTLPAADADWLESFSGTLSKQLQKYDLALVGGNMAQGTLSLSMTVLGTVPAGQAIKREGARAGDEIYVTGTLGDAAGGLKQLQDGVGQDDFLVMRYAEPAPRVDLGVQLRGLATAMIDISDGLLADLGHLCRASNVGGSVEWASLPISEDLAALLGDTDARSLALNAGDDYELCFTAPAGSAASIQALNDEVSITKVGQITASGRVELIDEQGKPVAVSASGYSHF